MTSYISVTDLFCGAGGSSLGAVQAGQGDSGVQVRIAVNHWRTAVDTHAKNFTDTDHDCADISQVHPSRYPRTSILIASPECTNYTRAKGKKRKDLHDSDLWGNKQLSPEEERSRVRMFDPVYFAEYHKYDFIVIENVVDVRLWVLYDAWLKAWTDLGYEYQELYWNSMFFHPTPQSRDRLYIVLWRKGMKRPNLEWRPPAWCQKCERTIEAVQSWKNPTKKYGKWGKRNQYLYLCPACASEVTPYYYCAWNCVDWSIPIVRIGDREAHNLNPLVPRTLERIRIGLEKFAQPPFMVDFVHSGHDPSKVRSLADPWPTQIANRTTGVFVPPFLVNQAHTGGHNNRSYSVTGPAPTQTASRNYALLLPPPFMTELRGGGSDARALTDPLATVTAGGNHHGLTVPPFLVSFYGQSNVSGFDEPMPTQPTKDKHALVIPPFLLSYYGGRDALQGLDQPVPTLPTANRHAVIQPGEDIRVEDCGFRMFKVPEIKKAMAFPDDYALLGNQDDQVKLLGNAVTPPPMQRMIEACLEVYGEAGRS